MGWVGKVLLDYILFAGVPKSQPEYVTARYQKSLFGEQKVQVHEAAYTNIGLGESQNFFAWQADAALELEGTFDFETCDQSSRDKRCFIQKIDLSKLKWNFEENVARSRLGECPFFRKLGAKFEVSGWGDNGDTVSLYRSLNHRQYCLERSTL